MNTARLLTIALLFTFLTLTLAAQTTEFTYQGNLVNNGAPATGNYDFEFLLYDALSGGTQLGTTQTRSGVAVANGTFSVNLDFGSQFPGSARFIEIRVRAAGGGAYTTLAPRQSINSTPYSVKSLSAENATNATNATTATNFMGTLAGDVTGTQSATVIANSAVTTAKIADANVTNAKIANLAVTDAKIADVAGSKITGTIPLASIPAGSGSYIQNSTTLQGASNFNISGTGTANIFSATTQYNIGGNRILSNPGNFNLFVGVGAGQANSLGHSNAFFGQSAGQANTTGQFNAFFGRDAGFSNTTRGSNAFFGWSAGYSNTIGTENAFFGATTGYFNTTGNSNAFFGWEAGYSNTTGNSNVFLGKLAGRHNTTGNHNTLIGYNANVGSGNLTNAAAIGGYAFVTQSNSLVLGSINGINNANADTRVGIGVTAPEQSLHVNGNEVLSTGSQSGFKFRERGSTVSTDDWVLFSEAGIGRIWRFGAGDILTFTSSGLVGINNLGAAGSTTLCRNASNQISSCSSSLRYKTNIGRFNPGMSFVNQLRPITFDWKDGEMKDVGFGAEDVEKIDPRFVTYNDKGEVEGVKYDRLNVVFVNAFKEQQAEISELRAVSSEQAKKIEEQKETINRQHAQIEEQKAVNLKVQSQIDALTKFICATNKSAEICKEK